MFELQLDAALGKVSRRRARARMAKLGRLQSRVDWARKTQLPQLTSWLRRLGQGTYRARSADLLGRSYSDVA